MVLSKIKSLAISSTALLGSLFYPTPSNAGLIPNFSRLDTRVGIEYSGDATQEHYLRNEIGIGKERCYKKNPIIDKNCDKFRFSYLADLENNLNHFLLGYTIPRFMTGDLEHSIFTYAASSDLSGVGFESFHRRENGLMDLTLNVERRTNDGKSSHFGTEAGFNLGNSRFSFAYDLVGGEARGKESQYLFGIDLSLSDYLVNGDSLNTGVAFALRTDTAGEDDKRFGSYFLYSSEELGLGFSTKTHFKINEDNNLEKFEGEFILAQNPSNNLEELRRGIKRDIRTDSRFSRDIIPKALSFRRVHPAERSFGGFALSIDSIYKLPEFARFWKLGGAISYTFPCRDNHSILGFSIGLTHNSLESRLPGPFKVLPFGGSAQTFDIGAVYRHKRFSIEAEAGIPLGKQELITKPFGDEETFPPKLLITLNYIFD